MAKNQDQTPEGVASEKENARLEHSQGGQTTRSDATDLGVPMLPGDPRESVGPEDALGEGPKRGDYRERIGPDNYRPIEIMPVTDAQPGEATVRAVEQRPRAAEIGDVPRRKGGVDSAEER